MSTFRISPRFLPRVNVESNVQCAQKIQYKIVLHFIRLFVTVLVVPVPYRTSTIKWGRFTLIYNMEKYKLLCLYFYIRVLNE